MEFLVGGLFGRYFYIEVINSYWLIDTYLYCHYISSNNSV